MKTVKAKNENLQWLEAFSHRISLPEEIIKEITELYKNEHRHIDALRRKKISTAACGRILLTEKLLKGEDAYKYLLAAVLLKSKDTLMLYREKGISENIFYDTMTDITIWSENHRKEKGTSGLSNLVWIQNHLNCKIFRLGRLQFQPFLFYLPPYVMKNDKHSHGIRIGEKVLNIHIPQGGKLSVKECDRSFEKAKVFFEGYPYKAFICDSWLLCERNKEYMSENSNILAFAERFEILGSSDNPSQAIERVFGKKEKNPLLYPENTSLQRQLKEHIISSGKVGTGFGIIRVKK